jgi:N-acetyl-gamma-glutamyl-phosphate reductase
MSIHAIVLGASGYVGGELLRLLHAHPQFDPVVGVSTTNANAMIGDTFPHLAQVYRGHRFVAADDWATQIPQGSDAALFSAAPHGTAAGVIKAALQIAAEQGFNVHVADTSADFRFSSEKEYCAVYGGEHAAPELIEHFMCSVPEHAGDIIAPHAGHPGCFATAALLASVPLVRSGLVANDLYISAITGSTGSGREATAGTHHPERHSNLYAYKALHHRHSPEIAHLIEKACGDSPAIHFIPHSGPYSRGIHLTLQAALVAPTTTAQIAEAFDTYYSGSPFVHFVHGMPRLKDIVASNYCRIGASIDSGTVAIMCVIDNLVKGAAGGAIQWMNRLWSMPEESGLLVAPPSWT